MSELIVEQVGAVGHIQLNRPQALNALTLDMVLGMRDALEKWQADSSINAVVVSGAGDRAFCAGGDVKAAWRAGRAGEIGPGSLTDRFFREEYQLNHQIANYDKPYVAWLDGITMGGGVGVSILGSHRLASEHMKFAMPETAIGFFPDVGGSYFLSRLGPSGSMLATTSIAIDFADSLSLGIATHYVPRDTEGLVQLIGEHGIEEAISRCAKEPPAVNGSVEWVCQQCFSSFEIDDILTALESNADHPQHGSFVQKLLGAIKQRSPTSIQLTLEQLRRGATMELDECLKMEFRMSQACMRGHDFFEGVRSVLVDKDHAPKWSPASHDKVDSALVNSHFASLGEHELQLHY